MKLHSPSRGSALLMVLWALAMLSMTIIGLVELVHHDADETIALVKNARALQLAESGVAVGLNPLSKKGDPILIQSFGPGEGFEVHLRSEGGRLNINTIVRTNQWQVLHDLFKIWGMQESDAVNVTQSIQEWTYPKQALQTNISGTFPGQSSATQPVQTGANGQPIAPATTTAPQIVRTFQSLDEMLLVPGMDLVADAKPDWKNYFTIWSSGNLDMNEAPEELIMAVCGVGEVQAERFIQTRLGPDGKPDTDDDVVFTNIEQVRQLLGMSSVDFQNIAGRISVQDPVTRIESTGILGTYQRKITVVAPQNANPPFYFLWQEQ